MISIPPDIALFSLWMFSNGLSKSNQIIREYNSRDESRIIDPCKSLYIYSVISFVINGYFRHVHGHSSLVNDLDFMQKLIYSVISFIFKLYMANKRMCRCGLGPLPIVEYWSCMPCEPVRRSWSQYSPYVIFFSKISKYLIWVQVNKL